MMTPNDERRHHEYLRINEPLENPQKHPHQTAILHVKRTNPIRRHRRSHEGPAEAHKKEGERMSYYGKDRRMANKGQTLEQLLRYSNERYKRMKEAVVSKQPTEFIPIRDGYGKVVNCKVVGKATVDFLGRVGSVPLAMEAKETNQDNIRFDRVEDHQADYMTAYLGENEAICLVVVSFSLNSFYAIPWPFWKAGREAWKDAQWLGKRKAEQKTITYNGQTWTTPGKASVKESELLPEWKVELGGISGLDYLRKYIDEPGTRSAVIH